MWIARSTVGSVTTGTTAISCASLAFSSVGSVTFLVARNADVSAQ